VRCRVLGTSSTTWRGSSIFATRRPWRARAITREQLPDHPNPDFRIRVIDEPDAFYAEFATDIVGRIERTREEGRTCVLILPVGPLPHFIKAAEMIDRRRLTMDHVHTFNMDEYANEDGETAPPTWIGSFQRAMWATFFGRIDPELRPSPERIHFPTSRDIATYGEEIAALGGADVCHGGIG
jgi:glucosamine-6-phosphate deaminase